ncbi:MAG: RDD family protein [Flavobacterium sp.]|nr:RDD family protein [Flavobacterium sp.]
MSELAINTSQNVNIKFVAASVGERMLASFLDILIKIAYMIVIGYFVFYLTGLSKQMDSLDNWSSIAIVIIFFFPILIYSIVLESIFEGQTIGKKITKIKVVKIDGYQASFGDYLIRWLFRIVENNVMGGLIGLIAMIVNSKTQRLGDMAAGTAVITLKNNVNISHTILEEITTEYEPKYPMIIKLSDNDMRIVKETFNRALAQDDFEMINKLKEKVEKVTGIKKNGESNREFIKTILKDYNFYTQHM